MERREQDSYGLILDKIDAFTRKYYTNELIRGVIFSLAFVIAFFLAINFLEFYLFLPGTLRKVLWYGFLVSSALVVWRLVVEPLRKIYRLGKRISAEHAAQIIGAHFSDVKDKLLNIIQLHDKKGIVTDANLLQASIDQKISDIKLVPFSNAIDLQLNRKYLKYLLAPALLFLFVIIAAPNVIKEGSKRLMYSDQSYAPKAPFSFVIKTESLEVGQFQDFDLELAIEGNSVPQEVFIEFSGARYKMKAAQQAGEFSYTFKNCQESTNFNFYASGYKSNGYVLDVISKPVLLSFTTSFDYPAYTGLKDDRRSNIGDLNIAEGTTVIWDLEVEHADYLRFVFEDSTYEARATSKTGFQFRQRFLKSGRYAMVVGSNTNEFGDSISYYVNVLKDQYPSIQVREQIDSVDNDFRFYLGDVSDDHGLSRLLFHYVLDRTDSDDSKQENTVNIGVDRSKKINAFTHYWNVAELMLGPGDKLSYYFEVFDNDGIRGAKSTKSRTFQYAMPTHAEFEAKTSKSNDEIKDRLNEALTKSDEVQKEIQEMKNRLIQKQNLGWEDKKAMENLLDKQNELKNEIDKVRDEFKENINQQSEYKEVNEDILKKQAQLEKMFDELMSPEMKELFEKLEKMMDEMDKDKLMEELENFDMSEDDLENELDRMLELFKQLEFEQKMEETKSDLEKLAEKQEELAEETKNGEESKEELAKKQEELNKEMEELNKEMEELAKTSEELDQDMDFDELQEQGEQAEQDQQDAMEQMEKGKKKEASDSQKGASEKMKDMAQGMQEMQDQMEQEQAMEDMDMLRQLLENLVHLSLEQESVMDEIQETKINIPRYVDLVQAQYKIKDDTKVVEDTLLALAKRVFEIESFVLKELAEIKRNLNKSIDKLEDRRVLEGKKIQQYTMTGYNNLALMLSEILEQMQQEMASQMSGSQMCQKPNKNKGGKGKKMMPSLREMQQQLNDQMKKMGQSSPGDKPGEKSGQKMSEEVARMAAKQAAIRQALKEVNEQMNSDGKNSLGDLKKIQDLMDQTEEDLVNKRLTEEMIRRQQDILTRMLEAEKAEKEREFEEERQSKTAGETERKTPPTLEEYLKKREAEIELFKTVPPNLKPYYKSLVEQYFKEISFR